MNEKDVNGILILLSIVLGLSFIGYSIVQIVWFLITGQEI
jgi:hypothetical protein